MPCPACAPILANLPPGKSANCSKCGVAKARMTDEEFRARVREVEAEEMKQPERWWYLSFATETEFLGAAIVRAHGTSTAVRATHRLGINPGGEAMAIPVPLGQEPAEHDRNRLLSRKELDIIFGKDDVASLGEIEDSRRPS